MWGLLGSLAINSELRTISWSPLHPPDSAKSKVWVLSPWLIEARQAWQMGTLVLV
jgi:hypothetical protein